MRRFKTFLKRLQGSLRGVKFWGALLRVVGRFEEVSVVLEDLTKCSKRSLRRFKCSLRRFQRSYKVQ